MTETAVTAGRIRAACTTITAAWPEMVRTEPAARPTGTIRRSSERVDPVHAHVLDVRAETDQLLTSWARLVLEELDVWTTVVAGDVLALAALLGEHATWLAGHEAGEDAAEELEAAARACHGVAYPRGAADHRFVGLCPGCAGRLDAEGKATWVQCPCGEPVEVSAAQRFAGREAADATASAAEIEATSFKLAGRAVTAAQVREWARVYTGKRAHLNPEPLRPVGTELAANGRRVDVYRLGEVWDRYDAEVTKRTTSRPVWAIA